MTYAPDRVADFIRHIKAIFGDYVVSVVRNPVPRTLEDESFYPYAEYVHPIPLLQLRDTMREDHRHISSITAANRGNVEIESCNDIGEGRKIEYWQLVFTSPPAQTPQEEEQP